MTAPNGTTPAGFLSSSGLAAFAAKTRADWEAEQRAAFTNSFSDAQDGFTTIKGWIDTLTSLLTTSAQAILTDIFTFFENIYTGSGSIVTWLGNLGSASLSAALTEFQNFLNAITNRTAWLATFKALIDSLLNITNLTGFLDTLKTLINSFISISGLSTFLDTLKKLVTGLLGIVNFDSWVSGFKTLVDFFNGLVTSVGSTLWTVLTEIVNFFSGVFTGSGSIGTWLTNISGNLLSVVGTILNTTVTDVADALYKLTGWRQNVPNLEGLISGILGSWVNPITGTNKTLVDLRAWADKLLSATSVIPSFNLNGAIPAELLALIGVGNIGNVAPNLITDAGFGSEAALQAGVGWTWDSGLNSTGSTGGAAKLLCDGGVKYMFSNLIAASPGQQLTVSVKTKYTKGSSAQANIIAAVRTYNGATVRSTDTVASLTATGTTSVGISGADASGFKTITGTFTVPANVDTVRLVLGVTTGTSGTTVWFDEASLAKTSKLPQDLVHDLGNTLTSLLPVDQFNTLLNTVANTTGATIQQVKDVLDGKLTADSALNGSRVTIGNISAEVIEELRQTWEQLGSSVQGFTGTAPTDIAGLASEFSSLVGNITALSSLIGGNSRDIFDLGGTVSGHTTLINGIDSKLQTYSKSISDQIKPLNDNDATIVAAVNEKLKILGDRVYLLEHPTATSAPAGSAPTVSTPTPVTTPPSTTPTVAPPALVSVSDEFERATLGGDWIVSKRLENGSNLGILNSHDAYMSTPGTSNTVNMIVARYGGTGNASISEYQKISATLGTKAGIPLLGSSGYNDLIGRAATQTLCLFCRFYPDGKVQYGYRLNSWTDTIIGTVQAPQPLTGGSRIEFYVGDKSINDQTKLYARVANVLLSPAYVQPNVLASMGKGWGFAMGHGLSDVTFTFGTGVPQVPATMNSWYAQEQS